MTASRRTRPPRRCRHGFTMIELVVTIGVLSMMMAAFGMILVQCRRVVSGSQANMRANAKVAAIAEVLRRDLRRVTKGGILCIAQSLAQQALVVTTGEPAVSTQGDERGMGSYVVLALRPNEQDDSVGKVLWRPERIFSSTGSGDDVINIDLATVQSYTRAAANSEVTGLVSWDGGALYMPPRDLGELENLWQALAAGVTKLKITWTDGSTTNGVVNWYGPDNPRNLGEEPGATEFISDAGYRALWTSYNAGDWPRAIRFLLTLEDPSFPEEVLEREYEIICAVQP